MLAYARFGRLFDCLYLTEARDACLDARVEFAACAGL